MTPPITARIRPDSHDRILEHRCRDLIKENDERVLELVDEIWNQTIQASVLYDYFKRKFESKGERLVLDLTMPAAD